MRCVALVIVFQFVTVTYAVYAFVLTLSVVLLSTPVASAAAVDAQRVAYTLAGALMIERTGIEVRSAKLVLPSAFEPGTSGTVGTR